MKMLLNCCFFLFKNNTFISSIFFQYISFILIPPPTSCLIDPQLYTSPQLCSLARSTECSLCWTTTLGYGSCPEEWSNTEVRPLRRTDTDFTTDYQMPIASQLRVELCAHLLAP